MSAPGPQLPPEKVFTREVSKLAKRIERLKQRRRQLGKKLVATNNEIREAERQLRIIVASPFTIEGPTSQLSEEAAQELIDRAMERRPDGYGADPSTR